MDPTVWIFSTPAASGTILGDAACEAAYTHPLVDLFGLPLLRTIALLAGFVSPHGFWLWGKAIVSLHPLASIWLTVWTNSQRAFGPEGISAQQILGLAFVEVLMLIMLALACTFASAIGVGLRLLWSKRRGEPVCRPWSVSGAD